MSPEKVWAGTRSGLNFIPLFTILDTPQLPGEVGIDLTENSTEEGRESLPGLAQHHGAQ